MAENSQIALFYSWPFLFLPGGTDLGHVKIPSTKDHGLMDIITEFFFSIYYVFVLF